MGIQPTPPSTERMGHRRSLSREKGGLSFNVGEMEKQDLIVHITAYGWCAIQVDVGVDVDVDVFLDVAVDVHPCNELRLDFGSPYG